MKDFVVKKFNVDTLNNLYFSNYNDWVKTQEMAYPLSLFEAKLVKKACETMDKNSMFELIVTKDSHFSKFINDLIYL